VSARHLGHDAPGAYDSATIRPLTSSLHRRQYPEPTWISTRPRGSQASTISSTIYANRTVCDGSHLAGQLALYKVGAERRFRSIYKWKAKFGGMDVSEAKRLRTLEDENTKLKRLLADAMLDNAALKDLLGKKW
jgi:putative transposase